jgi:methyl-accepting chemotaxis protein
MSITKKLLLIIFAVVVTLNIVTAFFTDRLMQASVTVEAVLIGVGIAGCILSGALVSLTMAVFLRPLKSLQNQVNKIADGDLRNTIQLEGNGEIGWLAEDLNRMIHSLNKMINGILLSANSVVAIVDTLEMSSERTAEGAREQADQATRIAAAAEQMSQTINAIAHNASFAAATSAETMDVTTRGRKAALEAMQTAGDATASVSDLEGMMARLSSKTEEISGITSVIKDIADQTSLLALNAAIEAARAGEQGLCFSVVADEVRKLAEKTINSTGDISATVMSVSSETDDTVKSMSDTSRQVSLAVCSFSDIGNLLHDIDEKSHIVQDQITLIAAAIKQQHVSSEEVARNIEKTSEIAHETEKMSGRIMTGIKKLSCTAEDLFSAGWKFRLFIHREACGIVRDISKAPEIISMFSFRQESYLNNAITRHPFMELLYVTDTSGRQITKNIAPAGFEAKYGSTGLGMDWSSRPWFTGVMASGKPHITDLYRSEATDSFCFTISSLIKDERGRTIGVLGADINLSKLLAPERKAA